MALYTVNELVKKKLVALTAVREKVEIQWE